MRAGHGKWKVVMLIGFGIAFLCPFATHNNLQAQNLRPVAGGGGAVKPFNGGSLSSSSSSGHSGNAASNNAFGNDSTQADTSATKGLVFVEETPDSVLRMKVFLFHHHTAKIWVDSLWNPTLDPTGVQFHDPQDALNGNYYLGKGSLGHPHLALFPTLADGLATRLQPSLYPCYAMRIGNIPFYQTLSPFSVLSYGGSLDNDHSLTISHTQNITPGWNASFQYRLLNPEGVYTSSGARNNYLNATTNYFSPDARLQMRGALIWQSFNIDENGGLSNDSIFILRLQSNRAGIPVVLSGSGTRERDLAAMARVTYSLTRQSDTYRHHDSIVVHHVNDSLTRTDTLDVVDTIPLHAPHVLNAGVVGAEFNAEREKRVFLDSTHWRQRSATLFWTNDAYADHRWRNPLKVTLGVQPRYLRAVVDADTLRSYTWLNPFARTELRLWKVTLAVDAEASSYLDYDNRRLEARLLIPFDSLESTFLRLTAVSQQQAPDIRAIHDASANQGLSLQSVASKRYALQFKHKEYIDLNVSASHLSHHVWYDTMRLVHEGTGDLWLLQASLTLRLAAGPIHLDMQQLVQHSTDASQMPLPLWMSKNSLYADFHLFHRTLRAQVGADLRYHTPYLAPLYDPYTGLFLQQDDLTVGGYIWGDVFVNLQVKRASIYLKAGHVNALWETPATYFLLPHYPAQSFGLQWGLTWCFFD